MRKLCRGSSERLGSTNPVCHICGERFPGLQPNDQVPEHLPIEAPKPKRRHKPVMVDGFPNRQWCRVCGAMRDMWGGKPYTFWMVVGTVQPWCPGAPKETQ